MDATTATLIGLGFLVLLLVAFFAVFRGRGKFSIKTKFGEAKAEGENPPLATAVPAGVKVSGADAGGDVRAHSASAGGVDVEKAKAGGSITATHTPGAPPPKRSPRLGGGGRGGDDRQ